MNASETRSLFLGIEKSVNVFFYFDMDYHVRRSVVDVYSVTSVGGMMKIKMVCIVSLFLLSGFLCAQEKRPVIVVSTFDSNTASFGQNDLNGLTDLYINELTQSAVAFDVVDRQNLAKIMNELQFQNTDWSSKEKIAKLGEALNANWLVKGQVLRIGDRMYFANTLIDIITSKNVSATRKEFTSINEIIDSLPEIVADLTDKIGSPQDPSKISPEKKATGSLSNRPASSVPKTPAGMVLIQGGTFNIGSSVPIPGMLGTPSGPVHQVTVSSFNISATEVTQADYESVVGKNPSHFRGANLPVEMVSWYDAVNYCNSRSLKEGRIPAYTVNGSEIRMNRGTNGYRLPTNAEWEYAARGGNASRGNLYAGSGSMDGVGWYGFNSGSTTHMVGQKQANEQGLYDMSGNVIEWCWDFYGSYSTESQVDPTGPTSGSGRIARGGSWGSGAPISTVSFRYGSSPASVSDQYGFRIVCLP